MDFDRAEVLMKHLADVVDHPPYDESDRLLLSRTLAVTSLQFAASARCLCHSDLALGAAAVLRSQYEALVRGAWVLHSASEQEVEKLSARLSRESEAAAKNMQSTAKMLDALEGVADARNLMIALREFKDSSWLPLNSFVHSGVHAVHWTRLEPPPQLLENMFRASNGLAVVAHQLLSITTGRHTLQQDVIAVCATFASVLPAARA